MSEGRRDKLKAAFTGFRRRLQSRSSSPSPDERREPGMEPGSDSTLQTIPFSAPEPPSARDQPEPARPPSPTSRSSNSAYQPTPESYGLFTFGNKRPPGDYNIDIVAVHGLGGHWEKTWTDQNGKLWLRDFLPSQIPKARIMSYGYNSAVFSKAVTGINEEAAMLLDRLSGERQGGQQEEKTRPIIFISHSLGGIVVKKALILAHERSNVYGDLLKNVRGSVFFGVPHRGANIAYWANFAANILKITPLGSLANTKFIAALKMNSETFADISQQFIERAAPLMIRTFFETESFGGLLIVDKDSACLGFPNEVPVGIAGANHRTMCRFLDAESQKYSLVWRAIKAMSDSVVTASAAPSAPPSAPLSDSEAKCLQCLYTSDFTSHRERVPSAVQGTCTWFLQHERYMTWKTEQGSSLLWVSADPGCGKSVLSSFLVGKLRGTESQAVLPGTVCFFFFKDDNDEQKNATFALCALLHQLFMAKNSLISNSNAVTEFKSKGQKLTQEFHGLWEIFTKAVTDPDAGNVICVIDGLDECEKSTRSMLIKSLVKLYSDRGDPDRHKNLNHLKIIVTSRPYQTIEDGFHGLPRIRLKVENETDAVSADIKLVVNARVQELGSKRNLPDNMRTNLRHSLIQGADRTFLWVSLILGILDDTPEASESEFNEILNSLPSDLGAVYEKILGRSRNPTKAEKILHIVVAAARPLTLDEMNVALAIQPDHKSIKDLKSNLISSFESSVKELCGLFVRVIDSKICLVHQTAKEFLIKDSKTNGPSPATWKHALRPVESNSIVANICIQYLLLADFEVNPLVINSGIDYSSKRRIIKNEVDLYTNEHTFLDYAAKHWAVHFREAQTKQEANLLESALKVCSARSKRFLTWFQVYWITVDTDPQCPQNLTNLMVASYFGHEVVVQLLLKRGDNVNEQVTNYGSALNMAALGRHRDVAQFLLTNGANLYLYGHEYKDLRNVREFLCHCLAKATANG